MAMVAERRDAHQCIVAPEGSAIAGPPGAAHRIGPHAMAHAELEHAGKARGRGRADHETLQNAKLRPCLAHAHHAQDRLARHQAVSVERQHEGEITAPCVAELAHIAGLVALIAGAATIMKPRRRIVMAGAQGLEAALFDGSNRRIISVAQDEIGETGFVARLCQRQDHRLEPGQGAGWILVAHGHDDGGALREGCVAVARLGIGHNPGARVPASMQQPKAEQRVPDAQHAPGCRNGEAGEHRPVDEAPALVAQNRRQPGQKAQISCQIERRGGEASAAQGGDRLQAGGRQRFNARNKRHQVFS